MNINDLDSSFLFKNESELQFHLEKDPTSLLPAFLEQNGDCFSKPISVGREINKIDNLYIDARGTITLVECKLSSNPDISRKVISQIFDYAVNLKLSLESFIDEGKSSIVAFNELVRQKVGDFDLVKSLIDTYGQLENWEYEFVFSDAHSKGQWMKDLEQNLLTNIKKGRFRLIIAISIMPNSNNDKLWSNIENLINIAEYASQNDSQFELSIMGISKDAEGKINSHLIWRKYKSFPTIQIIKNSKRESSELELKNLSMIDNMPFLIKSSWYYLNRYFEANSILLKHDTRGATLYSDSGSYYTRIKFENSKWYFDRYQMKNVSDSEKSRIEKIFLRVAKVDFVDAGDQINTNIFIEPLEYTEQNIDQIISIMEKEIYRRK